MVVILPGAFYHNPKSSKMPPMREFNLFPEVLFMIPNDGLNLAGVKGGRFRKVKQMPLLMI
jgi:hypothetical protein